MKYIKDAILLVLKTYLLLNTLYMAMMISECICEELEDPDAEYNAEDFDNGTRKDQTKWILSWYTTKIKDFKERLGL